MPNFFWYYTIWYFDMPMHFLGGLWLSLFFIWFFSLTDFPRYVFYNHPDLKLFLQTIVFVLIVGVLWEFFEFFTNNYIGRDQFNIMDTSSDIFFDLAGGNLGFYYFLKVIMFVDKNKIQYKDGH